jgi:phospholipid/cholesterol/gamma-HCH transport system ATP-binding protein
MDEEIIRFENVSLAFEDNEVLREVSFTLHRGEIVVLFGVTGTGKTLLLKLALGLLKPDSGRITVLGTDITDLPETELFALREKIGMVFQEMALFDSLPVRENVAYRLMEESRFGDLDLSEEEIDRRVRESLHFVGLEHAVDKMPSELSGGMQRRVGLARALVTEPPVVLYDSPTAGLDPVTSQYILMHVIKLRDALGVSALYVTHRLQDAFILAGNSFDNAGMEVERPLYGTVGPAERGGFQVETKTRILLLHDGGIYFKGTAEELLTTEDAYVQRYLA